MTDFPDNHWDTAGMPPLAGASVAIVDSTLWSIGGRSFGLVGTPLTNITYSFNLRDPLLAGRSTTPDMRPNLPIRMFDAVLNIPPSNTIRVFGGTYIDNDNMWSANPVLMESSTNVMGWRNISTSTPNLPIQACMTTTAVIHGDFVWLFGGRLSTANVPYTDTLLKVSISNLGISLTGITRPSDVTNWPTSRGVGLILPLNDTHLFLNGGYRDAKKQETLGDWWLYSLQSGTWTQGPSQLQTPRAGHRGVVVDQRYVFVSGGWTKLPARSFMELIDTVSGSTYEIVASANGSAPVPTILAQHNSVYIDNQILFFNGYIDHNDTRTDLRHNRNLYVASLQRSQTKGVANPFIVAWEERYVPGLTFPSHNNGNGIIGSDSNHSGLNKWTIISMILSAALILIVGIIIVIGIRKRNKRNANRDQSSSRLRDETSNNTTSHTSNEAINGYTFPQYMDEGFVSSSTSIIVPHTGPIVTIPQSVPPPTSMLIGSSNSIGHPYVIPIDKKTSPPVIPSVIEMHYESRSVSPLPQRGRPYSPPLRTNSTTMGDMMMTSNVVMAKQMNAKHVEEEEELYLP